MQKLILPGLLLTITLPGVALSQSLPEQLKLDGYLELSYLDGENDGDGIARGEIDLAYDNVFGNFGLSLGIDAFQFDSTTRSELYPAITYRFGDHLISAGMTRSALDAGYLPDRQVLSSSLFDLQIAGLSGSFLSQALLIQDSSVDNLGLRWDGRFGETKVGASYNRLSSSGNPAAHVYGLALRHSLSESFSAGDLDVFAAYEHIDEAGASVYQWSLGLEGQVNRFGYGLSLGDSDNLLERHLRGWVEYDVNDRLQISAEVLSLTDGGSSELYSLGARYNIRDGLIAELNYLDGSAVINSATEFSLRYEF